jgi:hypothetical protein
MASYLDYIVAQSERNPCLRNLCQFIAKDNAKENCKIVSLEFPALGEIPHRVDLDPKCLGSILNTDVGDGQGRLLIIEDLTKDIVGVLESSLDIDPLFFAPHIHGPSVEISSSTPSVVILPSKALTQDFLSLQYQRSIEFSNPPVTPRKMSRDSNLPWKVVLYPD